MRINVIINNDLINEAFSMANVKTKKELIELALQEFIQHHRSNDLIKLRRKIKIRSNYNYKKLRG